MYALNLADDGRILSVTFEQYAAPGMPIVDNIPDGNVNNWKFVDGQYVYDPLPVPPEPTPEPSANDVLNVLLGVSE